MLERSGTGGTGARTEAQERRERRAPRGTVGACDAGRARRARPVRGDARDGARIARRDAEAARIQGAEEVGWPPPPRTETRDMSRRPILVAALLLLPLHGAFAQGTVSPEAREL